MYALIVYGRFAAVAAETVEGKNEVRVAHTLFPERPRTGKER